MRATQANVDSKGRTRRVMAFTELGQQCRLFLGPVPVGIRYPPDHGATFGGNRRLEAEKLGYQWVKIPRPHCPVKPDFELLVSFALSLPKIRNKDDQRAYDAGLAAEYFLAVRKSLAPLTPASPGTSASHGESSVDPALLGFSALPLPRQEFMVLSMMLAHMTDPLFQMYQDYATPRDIFLDIQKRHSDTLAAGVPLLVNELHGATMRPNERVDDFFRRVRGYCSDLRSAQAPVTLHYAVGVIIAGICLARFDSLRIKYGMMRHLGVALDYWSCLAEYRTLHILNIALPI